jgi:hypothetical protein
LLILRTEDEFLSANAPEGVLRVVHETSIIIAIEGAEASGVD